MCGFLVTTLYIMSSVYRPSSQNLEVGWVYPSGVRSVAAVEGLKTKFINK